MEPIYLNPPKGGWPKGQGPPTLAQLSAASVQAPSAPAAAGTRFAGLQRGSVRQRGKMNRTEQKWADQLDADLAAGLIRDWKFETMRLRIVLPGGEGAKAKWFTPDFLVVELNGVERLDEVKGTGPDDAASILRLRIAADLYPWKKFRLVKRLRAEQGGGWKVTEL